MYILYIYGYTVYARLKRVLANPVRFPVTFKYTVPRVYGNTILSPVPVPVVHYKISRSQSVLGMQTYPSLLYI